MTRPIDHAEHHHVVATTQALAHAWLDAGDHAAGNVGVFTTDHQTAGLGRDGRSWVDQPAAAALVSVAVAGPLPVDVLEDLAPRLARAVADALRLHSGIDVQWRAPNDLYVGARKLGGVLVDARTVGDAVERLVVGVGVNVLGEQFVVAGREATALAAEGAAVAVDETRTAVARAIEAELRGG